VASERRMMRENGKVETERGLCGQAPFMDEEPFNKVKRRR